MRIVLLGGAGFIGAHLCSALAARGHRALVLDAFRFVHDLPLGRFFQASIDDRCARLAAAATVRRAYAPLADADLDAVAAFAPDVVVNLAAVARVDVTRADPREARRATRGALLAVERIAERAPVRRVVHISSSLALAHKGGGDGCPYAELKARCEAWAAAFEERTGVQAVIARPSGVYGPGCVNGNFLQHALEGSFTGRQMAVQHPHRNFVHFTHVADVAAHLAAICEQADLPERRFNIVPPRSHTLAEAMAVVERVRPGVRWREDNGSPPRSDRTAEIDTAALRSLRPRPGFTPLEAGIAAYAAHLETLWGRIAPEARAA